MNEFTKVNVKMNCVFLCLVVCTFVFYVVFCDKLSDKINEAHCELECTETVFQGCSSQDECGCSNKNSSEADSKNWTHIDNLFNISLLCTSQDMFHVEWDEDIIPFSSNQNRLAFFLHISSIETGKEFFTEVLFCDFHTILSVSANATYNVTLWALDKDEIFVSSSLIVSTPEENKKPLPVPDLSISLIAGEKHYGGEITWSPAEDLSCFYEIVLFCTYSGHSHHPIPAPEIIEVNNPLYLYEQHVNNLHYGFEYEMIIRAKSANFEQESENKMIKFSVPTCLETFSNLTICAPEQPEDLEIEELHSSSAVYDIHLTWAKPTLTPDFYVARVNVMNESLDASDLPTLNITGDATEATFKEIKLPSYYEVHLQAFSVGGISPSAVTTRLSVHRFSVPPMPEEKYQNLKILIIVLSSVGVIAVLTAILVPVVLRKFNLNTDREDAPDDQAVIGEGAFGVVWQSNMADTTVACKVLKDNASPDEIRQLYQEIEIMKQVGTHPNIVSMIGYITREVQKGPILVVEYCPKGSLLSHLREIYTHLEYRLKRLQTDGADEENEGFTNKLYTMDWRPWDDELTLTNADMISYGRQIASGMEFLSGQKVLHRDLAARNILMMDNKTVKVSDFGLSRDVYMDSIYCKTTNGKLPVRWMALESLTHQIYTSQSDVWSFGILMWEIASLGAIPYPGVEASQLLALLKRGERMSKPKLCPDELYSLMINCWSESPGDRPSFSSLKESFERMLSEDNAYLQIAFNPDC